MQMADNTKFYAIIAAMITLDVAYLWIGEPTLLVKAIICLNILGNVCILRSVNSAPESPPGTDGMGVPTEKAPSEDATSNGDVTTKSDPPLNSDEQSDNQEYNNTSETN